MYIISVLLSILREKNQKFLIFYKIHFFHSISLANSNASNAIINAVTIESKNIGNVKRYH